MAVTFSATRVHATNDNSTFIEYCTATLTGTYVTGGFTWNPFTIFAGKGSSPLPSSNFLNADFVSPLGYTYVTTMSGNTATTKILTTAATELANTTAVPDASLQLILVKRKL